MEKITFLDILIPCLTFLFGMALENLRHRHAKDLERQKAKESRETHLYTKRCDSYTRLLSALGEFNDRAYNGGILSQDRSRAQETIAEIEESWRNLRQVVNEGYYSESVEKQVEEYLALNCWSNLRSLNIINPTDPKIRDALAFFNAVYNSKARAYCHTIRDAIARDLKQQSPVEYVIKFAGEEDDEVCAPASKWWRFWERS
jgi:hypothetical protein